MAGQKFYYALSQLRSAKLGKSGATQAWPSGYRLDLAWRNFGSEAEAKQRRSRGEAYTQALALLCVADISRSRAGHSRAYAESSCSQLRRSQSGLCAAPLCEAPRDVRYAAGAH